MYWHRHKKNSLSQILNWTCVWNSVFGWTQSPSLCSARPETLWVKVSERRSASQPINKRSALEKDTVFKTSAIGANFPVWSENKETDKVKKKRKEDIKHSYSFMTLIWFTVITFNSFSGNLICQGATPAVPRVMPSGMLQHVEDESRANTFTLSQPAPHYHPLKPRKHFFLFHRATTYFN